MNIVFVLIFSYAQFYNFLALYSVAFDYDSVPPASPFSTYDKNIKKLSAVKNAQQQYV